MRNPTVIKYFEYNRKSSEGEDRQVQSIERQREENEKVIERLGLLVVDTFNESRSARIPFNRPAFDDMIARIKKGEAQGIVCWHLSRLSRNPYESGVIEQLLTDGVIQSIQTREREYLPEDNLMMLRVESSMAIQYSRDLGKSVKSGTEKKIRMGIAPQLACVGYLNTKQEKGTNEIIIDPERFHLIRKAWDLMLTGTYIPSKILDIATNEWGLRTRKMKKIGGKPLALSALYRVFNNQFYAGLFLHNGTLHQGIHQPMITLEEFDRVQKILGKHGKPRPKEHTFTYTGIMKCNECRSAITATEKMKIIKTTGEVKTYIYYYCCHRKLGANNCSQRKCIPLNELEKLIIKELDKYSISPLYRDFILRQIEEENGDLAKQEIVVKESLLKESSKLEAEIKNLLRMRLDEAISDEEYKTERQQREAKLFRIKHKIAKSNTSHVELLASAKAKVKSVTSLGDVFRIETEQKRKQIIFAIGWNHELKDKKLLVSIHKWLEVIEKQKNTVESNFTALELQNNITAQKKSEYFNMLIPTLRGLVEEVVTALLESHEL